MSGAKHHKGRGAQAPQPTVQFIHQPTAIPVEEGLPTITLSMTPNFELRVRLPGNPGNSTILTGVGMGDTLRDARAMAILVRQLQEAMLAHGKNARAQRQVGTMASLTVTQIEEFFRTNPEKIYQKIPTATAEEMGL